MMNQGKLDVVKGDMPRINGKPINVTVIQVYAPTTGADDEEIEDFYVSLQQLVDATPKKDTLSSWTIGTPNQIWISSIQLAKTRPGADCGSDHELLIAKFQIKLKTTSKTARLARDYTKAFDCVDHNKLWTVLNNMGVPKHIICLLKNLYTDQEATVRTEYGLTEWFKSEKGVRQGCILSPCLFDLYAEYIMRNAELDETEAGIKISGRNINNIRYADDTTLMA
ncbi:unnamed protein product [Rotaria socialis]|uniref:Reverse transcriptase domain-containing protein n=1 Tax=Rotaria socialis TaxID=392032 RepID=A0A821SK48_9BILA|nr:unnamed protein product [Rotaria socialis]